MGALVSNPREFLLAIETRDVIYVYQARIKIWQAIAEILHYKLALVYIFKNEAIKFFRYVVDLNDLLSMSVIIAC